MKKNIYLLFLLIPLQLKPTDSFHCNIFCGVIDCLINKTTGCFKGAVKKAIPNYCPKPQRAKNNTRSPVFIIQEPKSTFGRQSPQSGTGNIASEEDSEAESKKTIRIKKKTKTPQKFDDIDSGSENEGLWIKIKPKKTNQQKNIL